MSLTLLLVIITGLISYRAFEDPVLLNKLKHFPYVEARQKEYHRFITSGFVHGGWLHLLINLFVLHEFGKQVEIAFIAYFGDMMGRINYLLLYLLTIVFADIPTFIKHKDNPHFSSVGASGGVSGIVFVYILFAPWQMLYLYAILPIPGIVAGIAYLAYSSWASKKGGGRIDHDAHLYGAIFGFLFAIVLQPSFFNHFVTMLLAGPAAANY